MIKYLKGALYLFLSIIFIYLLFNGKELENNKISILTGTITKINAKDITIKDEKEKIYTFKNDIDEEIGSTLKINYINENNENKIIKYEVLKESDIPSYLEASPLFEDYFLTSYTTLSKMSINEKIAQMLMVPYKDTNTQREYQFGGIIFFAKDFDEKSEDEIKKMIDDLQGVSKIKLITATDEEGGTVTRINHQEKFSQELYKEGGFPSIEIDTLKKIKMLKDLGINLNLAPVVDVSEDPNDYIYKRTLGENAETVCTYAEKMIDLSKNSGVSFTLKHFPGYGNNLNTHLGISIDSKSYEDKLKTYIYPFTCGIKKGAEAIMMSHNISLSIDEDNPASLSKKTHDILRNDLNYSGIIITDDMNMQALSNIEDKEVKAIKAGNDIIITTDYLKSYQNILDAYQNKIISEEEINKIVIRILAWKYYKGLI